MGFILFIVSFLLGILVIPLGFIYGFIQCFRKHHLGTAIKNLDAKFHILALALDANGNLVCSELLQALFLSRRSIQLFGIEGKTISSVMSSNYRSGTLSIAGRVLATILIFCKDSAFNN